MSAVSKKTGGGQCLRTFPYFAILSAEADTVFDDVFIAAVSPFGGVFFVFDLF